MSHFDAYSRPLARAAAREAWEESLEEQAQEKREVEEQAAKDAEFEDREREWHERSIERMYERESDPYLDCEDPEPLDEDPLHGMSWWADDDLPYAAA